MLFRSNNEYLPVVIDPGETRYWVRKVPRLTTDDTTFLEKIRYEIPAFLHTLTYRQLSTAEESRMWFDPKLIDTDALQKIIRANRNRVELELAELLTEIMNSRKIDEVDFCFNDILSLFGYRQVKADRSQLRKVVQDCWSSACRFALQRTSDQPPTRSAIRPIPSECSSTKKHMSRPAVADATTPSPGRC